MNLHQRLNRRHFAAASLAIAGAASFVLPEPGSAAAQGSMNQPDGTYLFGSGEDLMPRAPVRWRALTNTAKPFDEAPELERTLAFLMPISEKPFVVDNLTTGETTFVVAHVAHSAFGAQGEVQKRYVEQGDAAPYVAFELIVADQDNPDTIGTSTWLGSTDPFTAPAGSQNMEMAALVVNADQPTKDVPDPGDDYPILGFVYQQPVFIHHATGESNYVAAGEAMTLNRGDVIGFAGDDESMNASVNYARFEIQRTY